MALDKKHGNATHGMTGTPEHNAWKNLKRRCLTESNPGFEDYGGRGISVCERWENSFENFYADMGPRPSEEHSIERRDVNGNYEPDNCYWATEDIQQSNKRSNVYHDFQGERLTQSELARRAGISMQGFKDRLARGLTVEQAMSPERIRKHVYTYNGQTKSLTEWAHELQIAYGTLHDRLVVRGLSFEEAIKPKTT